MRRSKVSERRSRKGVARKLVEEITFPETIRMAEEVGGERERERTKSCTLHVQYPPLIPRSGESYRLIAIVPPRSVDATACQRRDQSHEYNGDSLTDRVAMTSCWSPNCWWSVRPSFLPSFYRHALTHSLTRVYKSIEPKKNTSNRDPMER